MGGRPNLVYSPGPGLWPLVLGPFGPDLGPDLDLTWDLDLDLSLTKRNKATLHTTTHRTQDKYIQDMSKMFTQSLYALRNMKYQMFVQSKEQVLYLLY